MAVAPLPNVRTVLDYAVTAIPPEKILLGVPNYGYDWSLPFVQGASRAQSLSNQRAIELALQYQIAIAYDETVQAPFFTIPTMPAPSTPSGSRMPAASPPSSASSPNTVCWGPASGI